MKRKKNGATVVLFWISILSVSLTLAIFIYPSTTEVKALNPGLPGPSQINEIRHSSGMDSFLFDAVHQRPPRLLAALSSGSVIDGSLDIGVGSTRLYLPLISKDFNPALFAVVPSVQGLTQTEAEVAILAAQFTLGTATQGNSPTVEAGKVMGQNPAAGSYVAKGSAVNLVISTGPNMVSVPNVVDRSRTEAENLIIAASLLVGTVTNQYHQTVLVGSVISQYPPPGTLAAAGTAVNLVVSLGPEGIPPDPSTVASSIDPTVTSTVAKATEFLYTGTLPIQTGVAPGTIEPKRAAVIRGKVLTREGNPLPGVAVTILNHPEYGQTMSRLDGLFDIAVNGGGTLTVDYRKEGCLPAQRQVKVPWQDYVWAPEVALVGLDPQATAIDLGSALPVQVARGSVTSDDRGTRQPTLLFAQGTTAQMILPDGSAQPLSNFTVRATEYTVGPHGPKAMPAELPPNSGYTYCVEFTVDEALSTGAKDLQFSQPIINYLENYLQAGVGSIVPAGYYDRTKGIWIPSGNGQVIKILHIAGNPAMAEVDTDGDDVADTGLGITAAERERLAVLYSAGQTLWRVPVSHFTPWDYNWAFTPPSDATFPNQPGPKKNGGEPDPCEEEGSIIDCHNQTLGQAVAIAGSSLQLHYRSDRVPGYQPAYSLEIPLSGPAVPSSLIRIEVEIQVAGRRFDYQVVGGQCPPPCLGQSVKDGANWICRLPVSPGAASTGTPSLQDPPAVDLTNRSYTFTWDGKDAYGRYLQGVQPATVRIGYTYCGSYQKTDKFGYNGGGLITGSRTTKDVTLWQTYRTDLGPWDARPLGLGGWTLTAHHAYDSQGKVLYLGNGQRRAAQALGPVISTVAGTGYIGYNGDGIPATQARLYGPSGVAVGPDGSLYLSESSTGRIRRVRPDGIISTVAGTGINGYNGDGIPATQARLNGPFGVAVGPDASLYIYDSANFRVRRVGPDGIISTLAGTGIRGYNGDGIPATQAQIRYFGDVTLGTDGSLYIADTENNRIRRVGTDGIIMTVANVDYPTGIAAGPDGSLYFGSGNRVYRLAPDGSLTAVVGTGSPGFSGDGGPATQAMCYNTFDVAVGIDGSLYVADGTCVRRVGADGIINTIAGKGGFGGFGGDGGQATQAFFGRLNGGIALGPDDSLYIADSENRRLRRGALPLPGFSITDLVIYSADGSEGHIFNSAGRHLRTVDSLTGALRYEFAYDGEGRLTGLTDGDGNVTAIERDADGNPVAIAAPFGQRTALALNSSGYLASISNPAGEISQFTYTDDGIMTILSDPRGGVHGFTYNSLGLLTRDGDPAGGSQVLGRTEFANGYEVNRTTGENRTTTYRVENLSTGDKRRVMVFPDGTQNTALSKKDGSITATLPDGTVATTSSGPDPRFGMQAPLPKSVAISTPGGLTANLTMTRAVTLTDPTNPLTLSNLTDTVRINNRTHTTAYDAATRTFTDMTPGGRQSTTKIDALGRVIEYQISGLSTIHYSYDTHGRLISIAQGSGSDERATSFHYNPEGFVDTVTDPLSRILGLEYNPAGLILKEMLPDGRQIVSTYDRNGNIQSITPPDRPAHSFEYNPVNLMTKYLPPEVLTGTDETQYSFNQDQQLTRILRPDGQTVDLGYDGGGKPNSVALSRGTIVYDYFPATGHLQTITAPGGIVLNYTYDGSLLTNKSWTGPVAGSVTAEYDNGFRVTALKINNGVAIPLQYDNDNLLNQAGSLTLTYNSANGLLTGTTLAGLTDTWSYNSFGEPVSYVASYMGSPIFETQSTYDKLGRITQKSEHIGGVPTTWAYTYDPAGRLTQVEKNGTISSVYTYDSNDNRIGMIVSGSPTSFSFDAQDRFLTKSSALGDQTYSYSANGELQSKVFGGETTTYQYDALGNLMSAVLPSGASIDYLVDGFNRRIGKKVNGVPAQGFLYLDGLKPLAELDGSNNLVSVFVYGSRSTVPDYMVKGGVTYRIISDHLGSPRLVVNTATGDIIQRMDYDEFGKLIQDTNPGFQPFGFAGGLYDPQTGLVRFGARDYDPEVGRWTAKDPLLFDAWGSTNTYEYVLSDPVNSIDPEGKQPLPRIPTGSQQPRLSPGAEKLLNWQNEIAKPMMQKQFSTSPGGKGVEIFFKALTEAVLICMGGLPTAPGRSLFARGTPGWRESRRLMMQEIKEDAAQSVRNLPAPASLPKGAPTTLPNLPAPAGLAKPNLQVPVSFGP
jgi:RHS repeat-associated protein